MRSFGERSGGSQIDASVLVRVKNGAPLLSDVLNAVYAQAGLSYEVIAIDSGSTDDSVAILRTYPLRLLEIAPDDYVSGYALNLAASQARGNYLVCLSQDATPVDERWLEHLLKPFDDGAVAGVFGRQVPREDAALPEAKTLDVTFPLEPREKGPASFFSNANAAVRKSLWLDHNFDEKAGICEDREWAAWAIRSGRAIRYAPMAAVLHSHPADRGAAYSRSFQEGSSYKRVYDSKPSVVSAGVDLCRDLLGDAKWLSRRRRISAFRAFPAYRYAQARGFYDGLRYSSELRPAEAPFCVSSDVRAQRAIARQMDEIVRSVLHNCLMVESIAIVGGFGRGEGGVTDRGGRPAPVNDFDVLVVLHGGGLLGKLLARRLLRRPARLLSDRLGIRVDIAVDTMSDLVSAPATIAYHEIKKGHILLWGQEEPFARMPAYSANDIPLTETTRLLLNRGAALLWAREILISSRDEPVLSPEDFEFVVIALEKAYLAFGDSLLVLNGIYDHRYSLRPSLLESLAWPPCLPDVRPAYRSAVEFKLEPDFSRYRDRNLGKWLEMVVDIHEKFLRFTETTRTGKVSWDWNDYADSRWVKLKSAGGRGSIRNLARNLRRFGIPRRGDWLFDEPAERLVSLLPLLLYERPENRPMAGHVEAAVGRRDGQTAAQTFIEVWRS